MRTSRSTVLLIFSLLCVGCRGQSQRDEIPAYFVVVPNAADVKYNRVHGQEQLVYRAEADYPADDVLNRIKVRLDNSGWKPLEDDFLNPGEPSSVSRGWSFSHDDSTHPTTSLRSWTAQWENPNHDILEYVLIYRCRADECMSTEKTPRDLHVMAVYMPTELAQKMKSHVPAK